MRNKDTNTWYVSLQSIIHETSRAAEGVKPVLVQPAPEMPKTPGIGEFLDLTQAKPKTPEVVVSPNLTQTAPKAPEIIITPSLTQTMPMMSDVIETSNIMETSVPIVATIQSPEISNSTQGTTEIPVVSSIPNKIQEPTVLVESVIQQEENHTLWNPNLATISIPAIVGTSAVVYKKIEKKKSDDSSDEEDESLNEDNL